MQINARVDIKGLVDATIKSQKNLVFSVVNGINDTAKQIQTAQKESLARNFTLRSTSKDFISRRVAVIKPFADVKKGTLYAEVAVVSTNAKRMLLAGYEDGADRKPAKGKLIAQPVTGSSVRPTFADPIAEKFRFNKMGLKKAKGGLLAEKRYVGKDGIFTVKDVGVLRRFGSGADDVEMLYHYAKTQKLPKKLGWRHIADTIATDMLDENITQRFFNSRRQVP